MKLSLILSTVALLLSCGSAVAPEADTPVQPPSPTNFALDPLAPGATVVFYNVENLYDTQDDPTRDDNDFLPDGPMHWTEERLQTKYTNLGKAIALSGEKLPAMIGLAEVENATVVEGLARSEALSAAKYVVVHHESPDERGIDVALLVDPHHFNVLSSEALKVPLKNDLTRDILHAVLAGAADTFHVFVNHWPSRREGQEKSEPKRLAAANTLAQAMARIRTGLHVHVLVMGDFNDTPTDKSIQQGLSAGCDRKAPLVDLMCVDQPKGFGSHQYDGHWDYLDQFIVSQDMMPLVASAEALWTKRLLFKHPKFGLSPNKTYSGQNYKGGYSDHLPVVLRLK